MSKRKDILTTVKKGSIPTNTYGLIYTCNCGWLDFFLGSDVENPLLLFSTPKSEKIYSWLSWH